MGICDGILHKCKRCGKEHHGKWPGNWSIPYGFGVICNKCNEGRIKIMQEEYDRTCKLVMEYLHSDPPNNKK